MSLGPIFRTMRLRATNTAWIVAFLGAVGGADAAAGQSRPPSAKALAPAQTPAQRTARAVVVHRAAAGGKRQFDVVLELKGTRAGAYQGSLHFRPGTLTAIEARSRAGDGTRLINPADSAKGVIKFAGYTVVPAGFSDSVMVSVIANVSGSLAQADLSVTLEAVGGADGQPLSKGQLLPFGGVRRAP